MKSNKLFPPLFLLLGIAGCVLRYSLYLAATDSRGLLVPHHPLEWVLWGLTVCCAVLAVFSRKLTVGQPGRIGALGAAALAGAVLWQCGQVAHVRVASLIYVNYTVTGAAFAGLLLLALAYLRGRKPSFACYAVLCVYYCIQMVLCYQHWSERTQLQDYVFALGAVLCMALSSYYLGCAAAGMAPRRRQVPLGLMGIFFCCTAIPFCDTPAAYVCAALFLLTEFSALKEEG